ncbi:PAS domain-containing protein [Williamsia sterculiae]|uniref:PAS domain S-box-containing protein n=1 Tax=Williamsia sterculiae TaxID=1344003 RepID=A0A1N7CGQ5_9NOCA|nr:PAS domain-containing protein [Williamsia sterculiae]SIR62779.1 PAS domain S-box-containing protein [Williamsia sterculiae]
MHKRLMDTHDHPICVHSCGRIVYANAAAARWMGAASVAEMVGKPLVRYIHPDSVPAMVERLRLLRDIGDVSDPVATLVVPRDRDPVQAETVAVRTEWQERPAYRLEFRVGERAPCDDEPATPAASAVRPDAAVRRAVPAVG